MKSESWISLALFLAWSVPCIRSSNNSGPFFAADARLRAFRKKHSPPKPTCTETTLACSNAVYGCPQFSLCNGWRPLLAPPCRNCSPRWKKKIDRYYRLFSSSRRGSRRLQNPSVQSSSAAEDFADTPSADFRQLSNRAAWLQAEFLNSRHEVGIRSVRSTHPSNRLERSPPLRPSRRTGANAGLPKGDRAAFR